jgi:TolB-like protein/Tfp pilus assembly protein PilF
MNRLKQFVTEIHRRSLWQVLLIYCGAALVAYQAVQALTEGLGLPQWFPALAIVLFIVGLPIVLATAFVHEVAPPTVKPAEPTPVTESEAARIEAEAAAVHHEARRRHRLLTWRNAAATFVIVLAAWGVVATGWLLFGRGADEGTPADDRPSVAVLPLVNRSGLEEDVYFTDGIHDEILTQLSKISGLSVRARTSVMEYRDSPKNVRQIGEELNARYIMEGGVQRAGETVRINVQLIDSETDEHVFVDTYDRELSVENLLAVQREIAMRIAGALEATLTPQEREELEKVPTDNLEAYDYYVRGNDYYNRGMGFRLALQSYETAVGLDSSFALAYAAISRMHSWVYLNRLDRTEERTAKSKQAVDRALQLDPGLPEAHVALGLYYYVCKRDYERALDELNLALNSLPNSSELVRYIGSIQRRQGNWEQAIEDHEEAVALDPRSAIAAYTLAGSYHFTRNYGMAEEAYDRAITLSPDWISPYVWKAWMHLQSEGNTEKARGLLEAVDISDFALAAYTWFMAEVLEGNFDVALERLSSVSGEWLEHQMMLRPKVLLHAQIQRLVGDMTSEALYYDSARVLLEARVKQHPEDALVHSSLGIAYAGLGQKEQAIREGEIAVELLPVSKEALVGTTPVENLAQIYTMVGEYDAAVDKLEYLLSVPSLASTLLLQLDPRWDPLRDHPRFQALLDRYE